MSELVLLCSGFLVGWFARSVLEFLNPQTSWPVTLGGHRPPRPSEWPLQPPPRDP